MNVLVNPCTHQRNMWCTVVIFSMYVAGKSLVLVYPTVLSTLVACVSYYAQIMGGRFNASWH